MHGGVAKDDLKLENVAALEKGFANLKRHIANVQKFGVPVIVSVNRFSTDTQAEIALLQKLSEAEGVDCVLADHSGSGGAARRSSPIRSSRPSRPSRSQFKPLYADDLPLVVQKVRTIARELYGASDIALDPR